MPVPTFAAARRLPRGGLPPWAHSPWALGGVAAAGAALLALRARRKAGGDPSRTAASTVPAPGQMSQYDSSGLDWMNNVQSQLAGQASDFSQLLVDYLGRPVTGPVTSAAPVTAPSRAFTIGSRSTGLTTIVPSTSGRPSTQVGYNLRRQTPGGSWIY